MIEKLVFFELILLSVTLSLTLGKHVTRVYFDSLFLNTILYES